MMRNDKMKKLRTAVAGGTRIAGVALALALAAPGTGGHATAAAAAAADDHWKVEIGPHVLCIPVPCPEMATSCCDPFDPPGPVI
jgi:hypothetical protein